MNRGWGSLFSVVGFLLLQSNVLALQCPEPNEEYESILRKLKDFEARLAPQPECRSLQAELTDLRVFYSQNINRLKGGLSKNRDGNEVSEEEAQALSDYSTSVAEKISSIVAALDEDRGTCVSKEKQPSFLSSLASIARSATGLVGSFSGPYDLPIRIGGNLFAGILLGMDKILSGAPKYDFSDPDRHQLFVKNLCIYHDIRQEIQNTLEPLQRLKMYLEILDLLTEKEKVILEACKETSKNCEEYLTRFRAKWDVGSLVDELNEQTDRAVKDADSPWAECSMLADILTNEAGSVASDPKDIFDAILIEVRKANDPGRALTLMEETYQKITSDGFIPRRIQCWDLDEVAVEAANRRTRGIIKDLARMAKEHFDIRLRELLFESEDENVHEKRNYAIWLHKTYEKRFWAFNEVLHMAELIGPQAFAELSKGGFLLLGNGNAIEISKFEQSLRDGSDSARQQIRMMMIALDSRVLGDLAPQFIRWNIEYAAKAYEAFEKRRSTEQSHIRETLQASLQIKLNRSISIPELLRIVQCPEGGKGLSNEVCSNFASNVSDLLNQLGLVTNSLGAASVYCNFFNKAGTMNNKLLGECSSASYWEVERSVNRVESERRAYIDYIDWCHVQDKIDGDNARDIIQRIRSFVDETKQRIPEQPSR